MTDYEDIMDWMSKMPANGEIAFIFELNGIAHIGAITHAGMMPTDALEMYFLMAMMRGGK